MTDAATPAPAKDPAKGFLGWVERTGNKLPDPVFLFFYLIIALVVISIIVAFFGGSATLSSKFWAACQIARKRGLVLALTGSYLQRACFPPKILRGFGSRCPRLSPISIRWAMSLS